MKPLPQDPPVYEPPPERWFDRHEHQGKEMSATTKTLSAMWLTLHDRMRLPLPTAPRKFSLVEHEQLAKLAEKFGPSVMTAWRIGCNYIEKGEQPETAFKNLLAAKGLRDE